MIVKLTSEQISSYWPMLKFGVIKANEIPEDKAQEYTNELLKKLLIGDYAAWLAYERFGEEIRPWAFGMSTILEDRMLGFKYLYLDSLYGVRTFPDEVAIEVITALKAYAIANNCTAIRTQTRWPRVVEILRVAGILPAAMVQYEMVL